MLHAGEVKFMRLKELSGKLVVDADRTLDDLREEGHEQQQLEGIALSVGFLAVNVHDVAHRLEGVERDTQRQKELERRYRERNSEAAEHIVEAAREEAVILQKRENAEVDNQRQSHNQALLYLDLIFVLFLLVFVPFLLLFLQELFGMRGNMRYP